MLMKTWDVKVKAFLLIFWWAQCSPDSKLTFIWWLFVTGWISINSQLLCSVKQKELNAQQLDICTTPLLHVCAAAACALEEHYGP